MTPPKFNGIEVGPRPTSGNIFMQICFQISLGVKLPTNKQQKVKHNLLDEVIKLDWSSDWFFKRSLDSMRHFKILSCDNFWSFCFFKVKLSSFSCFFSCYCQLTFCCTKMVLFETNSHSVSFFMRTHQRLQSAAHLLLFLLSALLHPSSPLHLLQAAPSLLLLLSFTVAALKTQTVHFSKSPDEAAESDNDNIRGETQNQKESPLLVISHLEPRRSNSGSGQWLTAAEIIICRLL